MEIDPAIASCHLLDLLFKKMPITITKLFAVLCNDFMALVLSEEWKEKEHLIVYGETFVPKQLMIYVERLMFSI